MTNSVLLACPHLFIVAEMSQYAACAAAKRENLTDMPTQTRISADVVISMAVSSLLVDCNSQIGCRDFQAIAVRRVLRMVQRHFR